jgi:tight adherence protein B
VNGILPIVAGGLLLALGGVAAVRSGGSRATELRQLENRLREVQVVDRNGLGAGTASAPPQDLPRWLIVMLARADIVPRTDAILFTLVIFAVVALLSMLLFGWLAGIAAGALEIAGVYLALWMVARRRITRFIDDLPFFLDTTRQMLTAGNSIQQALIRATENAGPGMQRYLLPMVRRMQNGAAVGDSATWLAERLDVLELHMFATAIQTNVRYGGRLSAVLANLIGVLRDRSRVIRELNAATSEIRMSAIILGALPIVAAILIAFTNHSYIEFFSTTKQGNHLIMIAIALQAMGIFAMRWLMRLDY